MKTHLKLAAFTIFNLLLFVDQSFAQNIGINGSGATAHSSALLDIDAVSTPSLGILIPRIALQAINLAAPVTSPATSLLVYNTASASSGTNAVSAGYYYWDGAKWVRFAHNPSGISANSWNLLGNAGTNPITNFLGTTDAQDLVFRTNNLEAVRITTAGNVGIGTILPPRKLTVYSLGAAQGAIRNIVDGGFSGIEAMTFQNGIGGHPYFMGLLAGGTYSSPTYPLAGQALSSFIGRDAIDGLVAANYGGASIYMNTSENFSATNKGTLIDFATTTNSTNISGVRMRIDHNGNVGIGTTTPGAKLEIQDNGNRRTLHVNHDFNGLINTDAAFIGGIDAGYSATGLFVLQKNNVSFASTGTNLINVVSNSVSQMLINGSGYMGIGTTAPGLKLHLHDAGQNFHALRFTSGVSQTNYWDLVKRGDAYGAGQNHNFVIAYNLVEKLNITPTGEFGIGTATPTSRFDIRGAKPTAGAGTGVSNDAASQVVIADGSGGASYQNDWPVGWGGGLATWDICGTGAFFSLYNTRSDRRLKKDITDMNQSIEANFMKLRPVTYLLKKETPEINGTQYGFIAQEVAELFPTLVTKDSGVEGATIGMNYQGLIAPTIHVVQEQQKKIDQQQSQITELLKRIEALEKK